MSVLGYRGRTIVQMLLDAGATAWQMVDTDDDDENIMEISGMPQISCLVKAADGRHGRLSLVYRRVPDVYDLTFQVHDQDTETCADMLYFDDIAQAVEKVVGSEATRWVRIAPLVKAKKKPASEAVAA